MKSEESLGELKKKKQNNMHNFQKKELSNRIRFFLIVNFPMRSELVFLSLFIY